MEDAPSRLLPELMRLADARLELDRCEPDEALARAAREHVGAFAASLHASAWAPSRPGAGAAALWERLVDGDLPLAELDGARAEVVRAHPRGVDAALGVLALATCPDDERAARARRLVRRSAPRGRPRVRWICGVVLTG